MTGNFKAVVIRCLSELSEFKQFQRTWDIEVSVEREQLPEGATAEEEDSDEEYEDASSGWMHGDSVDSSHLVTDSTPSYQGSQGSLQTDSSAPIELSKF